MGIQAKCPNPRCAKVITVSEQLAGKSGNCRACGTRVTVPKPAPPPPPDEEEVLLVEVRCPNRKCGRVIRVRAAFAGRTGKCPACATAVTVPELEGAAAPQPVRKPAPAPVAPPKREGDTDEIVLIDEFPHGKGREGPPTVQNLDDE